jgi:hypothetical protein
MSRSIEKKMVEFIDKKLAGNGLAQEAIKTKDARTLMGLAAEACVGIREEGGNNKGPMVKLIQETIGSANKEAWCMSFVQTCIAYAELKTGVKSPVAAGEHCLTVWAETPKAQRVKLAPLPYAIVIWQHGKTSNGHTGFCKGADNKEFKGIEGNTESGLNSKGDLERDGGGVYVTKRLLAGNGNMKIVGMLKPF